MAGIVYVNVVLKFTKDADCFWRKLKKCILIYFKKAKTKTEKKLYVLIFIQFHLHKTLAKHTSFY